MKHPIIAVAIAVLVSTGTVGKLHSEESAPPGKGQDVVLTGIMANLRTFVDNSGNRYTVSRESQKDLLPVLGATIKIQGTVQETAQGQNAITVSHYEVVEKDPPTDQTNK